MSCDVETFHNFFWLNKFLMQACGILPISSRYILLNYFTKIMPFVTSTFLVLPIICAMCARWEAFNIEAKTNIIIGFVEVYVVGGLKVFVLLLKCSKISELIKTISEIWTTIDDEVYKEIAFYATQALYFTYGFTSMVTLTLISVFLTPLQMEFKFDENGTMIQSKDLPYTAGIFHNDLRIYKIWYGLQIPAGFLSITHIIAPDVVFIFIVLHGCVYAKLCQIQFDKAANHFKKPQSLKINVRKTMIKCIIYNQKFLEHYHATENVFHFHMLIQMISSLALICCYSISVLYIKGEEVKNLMHLTGAVIELWMHCWPSHSLWEKATALSDAAYALDWYNWSWYDQKLILFIMTRSQLSRKFTAANFAAITMETFISILSTAMSFFTVLRQMI
uniref:Odorant receptor n=1 Tax=Aulacocentrum confusum TaxID=2767324 RepID=A0A7G8Z952_9HYME|nr:olfactory receptor 33 [Aulacocentrum confusum]